MNRLKFVLFSLLISFVAVGVAQEVKYPPTSEYLMAQDAEIALAKSAAPDNVSGSATIKVLTPSGFQVVQEGANGFVCMVMRGSAAPTLRLLSSAILFLMLSSARLSVSTPRHPQR